MLAISGEKIKELFTHSLYENDADSTRVYFIYFCEQNFFISLLNLTTSLLLNLSESEKKNVMNDTHS